MPGKILRLHGCAMPGQVLGRRTQDAQVIAQLPGHQAVVSQLANADGSVETLADQVDETIGNSASTITCG